MRYRVILLDLLETEEFFKERMSILGVPEKTSREIIAKAPVILKEDTSIEYLTKYARAVSDAGGRVGICSYEINVPDAGNKSIEPLKKFTLCSQCGYKQLRKNNCIKCGKPLK